MQDFGKYLNQPDDVLLQSWVRVVGELATAHEELASCQVGHEAAYVHTLMGTDGSVADRERYARQAALHLKVSIWEVSARVDVLRLELALLRYLLDRPNAE